MEIEYKLEKGSNNTIQAFWVAMGSLSSIALGIVSAAILSRYLDKTEYGTYKQILYVYSTLLIVFSAGLPRVFAYFLPRYSIEEGKTIVRKINRVLFIAGLIFSLFLFLFSGIIGVILKNPELSYGLKIFSPIPMLLLPTLGIEGIFSTYKKSIYIAIYNTLSRFLMLIFIVTPVIVFEGSYITAIYGWLAVSVITFIMAYYFKNIPFKGSKSIDTTLNYKEVFAYSLPLVGASIWGIAIKSADQFYISRYFGTEVFAEFSNGFIELPFVGMVTSSASVVLMPIFSKVFHQNEGLEKLTETWKNTLTKSATIIYPILIFFFLYANELMILLYSQKYAASGIYFRINMFLNFFNIIIFAPLFLSMGKTKLYSLVHMILAFTIWISNYLLILLFNTPIAIAYNSTFLNILKIICFMYLASRLLNVKFLEFFPIKTLSIIILHGGAVAIIVRMMQISALHTFPIFYQIVISGTIYILLMLGTGKLFKIDYLIAFKPLLKMIKK